MSLQGCMYSTAGLGKKRIDKLNYENFPWSNKYCIFTNSIHRYYLNFKVSICLRFYYIFWVRNWTNYFINHLFKSNIYEYLMVLHINMAVTCKVKWYNLLFYFAFLLMVVVMPLIKSLSEWFLNMLRKLPPQNRTPKASDLCRISFTQTWMFQRM